MILEEETFKKFGYYPSDLKPKSNKKIIAVCDDCGKIREIQKEAYRALCLSCSRRGKRNPNYGGNFSKTHRENLSKSHIGKNKGKNNSMYGKHHSEAIKKRLSEAHKGKYPSKETREKMSEAHSGEKSPLYGKHLSEETKTKIRKARKHQSFPKHHSKPELIFEEICKNNHLDMVKYTGNSKIWVGNINPDFIINHGKRIAIFINGDYWHSPFLRPDMKECQYPTYQIKTCKKHRWTPLIIWERDLMRKDAESFILSQLNKVLK